MVYPLNYRRPAYVVSSSRQSFDSDDGEKSSRGGSVRSGFSGLPPGIPESLSFDKIINSGTCPPCTVRDFMNYLLYIEHSAENLQFFLWYRDFSKRFKDAETSDKSLAPEWTQAHQDSAVQAVRALGPNHQKTKSSVEEVFKDTDFESKPPKPHQDSVDPFITPPRTPGEVAGKVENASTWESADTTSTLAPSNAESYHKQAGEAFKAAGLKQPFTIQPFREEIDRVIATYLRHAAPRELNISDRERLVLLRALEYTTHPSAFKTVLHTVETSLRRQSHPNFIRWTICNGNRPRVIFARGLGVSTILLGIAAAIVLTLSSAGRGWRALGAIGWFIGTATLIAAWKGMCVVLHGMHHRHLRPWELFEDAEVEVEMKKSFESFDSSNSYEDQPWIVKYEKRNLIRKVFDREVWIDEPALRQIQDTIFVQSLLAALLISGIGVAVFVPLPAGNLF